MAPRPSAVFLEYKCDITKHFMIQVLIRELLKASEWNVEVAVNSILRSDEDDGEKQQELQVLR
jgi:hypothetical protein